MPENNSDKEKGMREAILGLSRKEKYTIYSLYATLAIVTIGSFILAFWLGAIYLVLGGLGIVCYVLGLQSWGRR